MDDIITGTEEQDDFNRLTENITTILSKGGFLHKGFLTSKVASEEPSKVTVSDFAWFLRWDF